MPSTQYYTALFKKLLQKELSPEDTAILLDWLSSDSPDATSAQLILQQLQRPVNASHISPQLITTLEAKLPSILASDTVLYKVPFFKRTWVRYAAACILLLGGAACFWLLPKTKEHQVAVRHVPVKHDVAPGTEGAVLTLADGRTVVLDSLGNGVVATQNGAKLVLRNGQLVYDEQQATGAMAFNTMSTPKGRQFKLQLPDGTQVWLNAASSLRYPVAFTGKERVVEIKGEAYFEVAKMSDPATGTRVPFRVQVNGHTAVEVLGTHFNINSYDDESHISTTLLEGAVKVVNDGQAALLKPGQQARIASGKPAGEPIEVIAHADVDKVMAWKNGVFDFQDATLAEVMRQLERWYNIEVVYEKGIPRLEFIGKMGRDLPLSDVLRGLEVSNVHFRMEAGRRVVVLP